RILLNLHGGGFSGCWPGCAELESIPLSALGQIEVVSVDYREGPDHKFPAASEDVASDYQELLKTHQPNNMASMDVPQAVCKPHCLWLGFKLTIFQHRVQLEFFVPAPVVCSEAMRFTRRDR